MTLVLPKFSFKNSKKALEEFKRLTEEENKPRDFFAAGTHEVEIGAVEYTGQSDKDPTWAKFRFVLSRPGAKVTKGEDGKYTAELDGKKDAIANHTLLFPTTDDRVFDRASKPKRPTFMYRKAEEFLANFGIDVSGPFDPVVPHLENSFADFVGAKMKVDFGWKDAHIDYVDGVCKVVDKEGKPLVLVRNENSFANRNSAKGAAAVENIKLQDFIEILKFHKAEPRPAATKAADTWEDD